ncbi:MAG: hypothetical protein ACYC27_05335 [Armatimonadota bacterium]
MLKHFRITPLSFVIIFLALQTPLMAGTGDPTVHTSTPSSIGSHIVSILFANADWIFWIVVVMVIIIGFLREYSSFRKRHPAGGVWRSVPLDPVIEPSYLSTDNRKRPFSIWLRSIIGSPIFQFACLWVAFPLIVLGLNIASTDLSSYRQFRSHIAIAQGRVIDSDVDGYISEGGGYRQSSEPGEYSDRFVWLTDYAFRIPGSDREVFGKSYAFGGGVSKKSVVRVEYRTDNPDVSRIVGQRTRPKHFNAWGVIPWLILWTIPGILLLRVGMRRSRFIGFIPEMPDAAAYPGLRVEDGELRDTARSVAGALSLLILPVIVLGGYVCLAGFLLLR